MASRPPPPTRAGDPPRARAERAAHSAVTYATEIAESMADFFGPDRDAFPAIDPPSDAWAEPTRPAEPLDRRAVYNRPTNGHPPGREHPPIEARQAGQAMQAPADVDDFHAQTVDLPRPRCISPPRPDGHTRARIVADPEGFSPALAAVIAELRRARSPDEERRERAEGALIRYLATPSQPGRVTAFLATVKGTRRQILTFYCADRVHIFLNCDTGECRIDWKAKELWSSTWAETGEAWISDLSELLFGRSCELSEAFALGWRMTGIEICADYVGFPVEMIDAARFAGGLKPGGVGLYEDMAETINLGTRAASNVSIVVYNKTVQVRDDKGGDDATYRSSWIAGGYSPDACGDCPECSSWLPWDARPPCRFTVITRVEIRLQRFGLRLATIDPAPGASPNSRVIFDFRDPATLADVENIGKVWRHCTGRHRLVTGERSRRRRDAIDPRWAVVIKSGGAEPPALRQFRAIQADAWENKVVRATKNIVREIQNLAALHAVEPIGQHGNAQMARFAFTLAMRDGEIDPEAHGAAYYALACPFVGPEIWRLGRPQWEDYERAEGATGIRPKKFSVWTPRGALDRALSQDGPDGPLHESRNDDGESEKRRERETAPQRGSLCGDQQRRPVQTDWLLREQDGGGSEPDHECDGEGSGPLQAHGGRDRGGSS